MLRAVAAGSGERVRPVPACALRSVTPAMIVPKTVSGRRRLVTAAAALLVLAGCGRSGTGDGNTTAAAPVAAVAAPAGKDWSQTTAVSPAGGFVLGNPDASVKLVEYGALTCPHCAEFSKEATAPLTDLVKSGRVSWEFRTFMIHPLDLPVAVLVRCQGPEPAFALTEQTYAAQPEWVANVQKLTEADVRAMGALPQNQQLLAFVKAARLDEFFRQRGLPEARIEACLKDQAQLDKVQELTKIGSETDKITGTPSFLINGVLQDDVYGWDALAPKLHAALGG